MQSQVSSGPNTPACRQPTISNNPPSKPAWLASISGSGGNYINRYPSWRTPSGCAVSGGVAFNTGFLGYHSKPFLGNVPAADWTAVSEVMQTWSSTVDGPSLYPYSQISVRDFVRLSWVEYYRPCDLDNTKSRLWMGKLQL